MSSEPCFEIKLARRIGDIRIDLNAVSYAPLTALTGASGAGKTTTLNCIAGLLKPESGRIVVGGRVLFDSALKINLAPEKRRVGYVFQQGRLFPHMNVAANLAYGEKLHAPEERWITQDEVVDFLGIGHLLDRPPATLSGGEVRRVTIGRALLSAPKFLLMDEPLTSLDAARGEEILRVVERIRDELALPVLYVSHDMAEVERLTGSVIRLGA
ncbi:molybdenum ABC transporter ATP-binding protein [Erythrobacter sp. SG61-1L]|uniref:ATP-binding cassette domain-containing protein n=1 Tax=Erythrobacter sp. SG61-1L TaxID=1603897 RepID=UPI0006C90D89|nr:ATP-binding cassette domain-containing protein [Erythrobacter sp. SG61-1L]KPL68029.1 molybdenum ABC transporter ATP-binding protein [Erythrobacter sp. SG61-1L]